MILRDQNRRLVILDQKLGAGGEAAVFSVLRKPDVVAKVYHRRTGERAGKLQSMLANAPSDPTAGNGHVSICWPTALLFDWRKTCAGFLMPRIDFASTVPVFRLYNPRDRQRVSPGFTWRYLLRTAFNLASAVEAIHARGCVIGDFNESNVLVTNTALVTLVDCDSMQVPRPGTGTYFRCTVGKPDFTPPELQTCAFDQIDRTPSHDSFSLGVMIFLLLMEGVHPFNGVWRESGDAPPLGERIRLGCFPYAGSGKILPAPSAPPFDILPADVRALTLRCFGDGFHDPMSRPSPREWRDCLMQVEKSLIACGANPHHVFANHISYCPWCERRDRLGGFDPYPVDAQQVALGASPFAGGARPRHSGEPAYLAVPKALYGMWLEQASAPRLTASFRLHVLAALTVLFGCLGLLWPDSVGAPMAVISGVALIICLIRIGMMWSYPSAVAFCAALPVPWVIAELRWYHWLAVLNGLLFALLITPLTARLLHSYRQRKRLLYGLWGLAGVVLAAVIIAHVPPRSNERADAAPSRQSEPRKEAPEKAPADPAPRREKQLSSQNRDPLTWEQIVRFIRNGQSDAVLAREIRDRRVAFVVCATAIDILKKEGARPQTRRALEDLKVDTTLTISTQPAEPDCEVIVDGSGLYRTDAAGRLVVDCLEPREHEIIVRKRPCYRDTLQHVDLSHGPKTIPVVLKPVKGFLSISVSPSVPNTTITVDGVGTYSGSIKNVECDPGDHRVKAWAPCHTFDGSVQVPCAGAVEKLIELNLNSNCILALVAEMNGACKGKSYEDVIMKALAVLALQPTNRDALRCIAQAYYRTDQFANSVKYARDALDAGETIELPVIHRHGPMGRTHPDTILISRVALRFETHPDEIVPLHTVTATDVKEMLLTVRGREKDRWDFADWKSQIVERRFLGNTIVPRKEALASLTAIQNILDYARRTR